jgi:hypothetical protein
MAHRNMRTIAAVAGAASLVIVTSTVRLDGQEGADQVRARVAAMTGTASINAFIASRVQKNWSQPKTPWGDPDISGVFTTKDEANTPLERPDEWAGRRMEDITPQEFAAAVAQRQQLALETAPFAGGGEPDLGIAIAVPIHWFDNLAAKNSRPWFVVDPIEGKIPAMTAEATKRAQMVGFGGGSADGVDPETARRGGRRDTYLDRYLGDRCIMFSVTHQPGIYGNSFQLLQTPTYVVLRYEMIHEARLVPIGGRPHTSSSVNSYMGDSRGWWDGNTLVVETINFHETAPYIVAFMAGVRPVPGKNLRVIERFTRIAPDRVEWTVTLHDSTTWERPWTYSLPMTEDNSQPIFEYACHEGNYGMANLLSAGRAADPGERER